MTPWCGCWVTRRGRSCCGRTWARICIPRRRCERDFCEPFPKEACCAITKRHCGAKTGRCCTRCKTSRRGGGGAGGTGEQEAREVAGTRRRKSVTQCRKERRVVRR